MDPQTHDGALASNTLLSSVPKIKNGAVVSYEERTSDSVHIGQRLDQRFLPETAGIFLVDEEVITKMLTTAKNQK